jgi:myosin protein heavy chain
MFILEQEIYKSEEIDWNFIDFGMDLEPTIRTIESSNPIGVLSYLDEECVMPSANDKTLLDKLRQVNGVESLPFKDSFSIKHYAGKVEYEVKNWLSKNKDVESEVLLLLVSENKRGRERENRQFIKK